MDSQDIDGLENELNRQSVHKMTTNTEMSAQCITMTLNL